MLLEQYIHRFDVWFPMHREMANYPTVDRDNDYLMSRFDGAIVDAQPWGRGDPQQLRGDPAHAAQPSTPTHAAVQRLLHTREVQGSILCHISHPCKALAAFEHQRAVSCTAHKCPFACSAPRQAAAQLMCAKGTAGM